MAREREREKDAINVGVQEKDPWTKVYWMQMKAE